MIRQESPLFSAAGEKDVTRAIVRGFAKQFDEYIESDVIIAGAGPAGLMCGRDLAAAGRKVLIVENNNYLGGGYWVGGYFMNKVTFRAPAEQVLDELGVPHEPASEGLYVTDGPHACSKLIAAACEAGVRFLQLTSVEDLVVREGGRVGGTVINWSPVHALPRQITCVDPVAIEATLVIDATGHDARLVEMLQRRQLRDPLPGCGAMWVERSEDALVEHTGEVHPGLLAVGMSVASVYGLPRMGPTFGGMLLSGRKGAAVALAQLEQSEAQRAEHVASAGA